MNIDLQTAGIAAFLLRNDAHTLHHNLMGLDFKDTHEFMGSIYDMLLDHFDYFMEHAILVREIEAAPNITKILASKNPLVSVWKPIEGKLFSVKDGLKEFMDRYKDYIEVLDLLRQYCEKKNWQNISSDIDQMKSDISLEVDYKIMRTIK